MTRAIDRRLGLAVCLCLLGCSKSEDKGATTMTPPPADANRVWFAPDDVMTAVDSSPIFLTFQSPPSESDLELIRSRIEVRTYPARVAVPFRATLRTSPASPSGESTSKYVDVTVEPPGPGSWFVVSVSTLPDAFRSGSAVDNTEPDLGAVVSRINRGSAPVIRLVRYTEKGRVSLVLSEGVAVDPASIGTSARVSASDGTECKFVPIAAPPDTYSTLDFDCPAGAVASKVVRVELHPGLRSPAGVTLGVLNPCGREKPVTTPEYTATLDFSNARTCSTTCREMALAAPCRQ